MNKRIDESLIENEASTSINHLSISVALAPLLRIIKERMIILRINKLCLIKKVLQIRDLSITKINSLLKRKITLMIQIGFILLKEIKSFQLMKNIISQRASACITIQATYLSHFYRQQYLALGNKAKDCFAIIPSVGAKGDKMIMRIYFKAKTECVKLTYCNLRKANVIDIPRIKALHINGRKLKFNFIINKQVVIDPTFTTLYDNDTYCNMIDFDLMEKRRIMAQKTLLDCLSCFYYKQGSFNESKSTNDDEDDYFNIRFKDDGSRSNSFKNEIDDTKERTFHSFNRNKNHYSSTYTMTKESFDKKLVRPRKKMTITSEISSLKSILKPLMSTSSSGRCVNSKKVCFGKVQFSF